MTPEIAVLIPCFNEQEAIGAVVSAFKSHIPQATIFVYDNGSTDLTIERARNAGAIVRSELLRGKGYVVRRMFADIEADIYVLVDGDGTYDAASAPKLIAALIGEPLDLVSAVRVDSSQKAYRPGHRFGNWLLTRLVAGLFGTRFSDMLSGYRVMSRRFVKSFPALSTGFEIEQGIRARRYEPRRGPPRIHTESHTPYRSTYGGLAQAAPRALGCGGGRLHRSRVRTPAGELSAGRSVIDLVGAWNTA